MAETKMSNRERKVRQWLETDIPKRKKMTVEDIAAKQVQRDTERQEHRDEKPTRSMGFYLRATVGTFGVLSALGLGAMTIVSNNLYEESKAANIERIEELSTELATSKDGLAEVKSVELPEVLSMVDKAQIAANEVASLQNQYANIQVTTEVIDGKAELVGQDELKSVDARLTELFTDEAVASSFDPTIQWYRMQIQENGIWDDAPGNLYSWEATEVLDPGTGESTNVVWKLYKNDSRELLGWAMANYSADLNKFSEVTFLTTVQGDRYIGASDSGVDGTIDQEGGV